MNSIAQELQFDILINLDIRSLLNFRLVNKYYKEFVDNYFLERKYKKFKGYHIEFDDQVVFYANTCKTQKLTKLNLNLMYTAFTMYDKDYLQFGHGGVFRFNMDYSEKWYICWFIAGSQFCVNNRLWVTMTNLANCLGDRVMARGTVLHFSVRILSVAVLAAAGAIFAAGPGTANTSSNADGAGTKNSLSGRYACDSDDCIRVPPTTCGVRG